MRWTGFCCGIVLWNLLTVCWIVGAEPTLVQDELTVSASDWPWWRGPARNGTASAQTLPPLHWNATEGIVWKTPVPGRGHGSPIVVGRHVLLAVAEHEGQTQEVACFDRDTGQPRWQTVVHRGGLEVKNERSTAASATPACDGERVYINFLNHGAVFVTAIDLSGQRLWQTKVSDYVIHQGYGASPALYRNLVIAVADNKAGGAIAGLDRATGRVVWRRERPATPNYSSPILIHAHGRDQLILTGCDRVVSFDPLTGQTLWETSGATTECVTSTVTDGQRVFSTGGYPRNHVAAILADGSGTVGWENNARVYVPSMLVKDGFLFAILDAGTATCWQAATGEERWKTRLGGTFSSSPVLVGDRIYATNEAGETFVFRATPDKFELLAQNPLQAEVFSTPAICGGRIYLRVAEYDGDRRHEFLLCLGADAAL